MQEHFTPQLFRMLFQTQQSIPLNMKTTFKNLSKGLMAAAFGLVLVFAGSAFTTANGSRVGHFYRYKLTTYTQAQIQSPANYERIDDLSCNDGINVCGVFLPTDNGSLSQPSAAEFNAVKGDLWASEQADEAISENILMKN